MIIDDKVILLSPPPYQSSCSSYGDSTPTLTSLPLISNPNSKPTLTYLSPHILLQIIHTVLHGKPQLPTYNPHDRYDAAYYEETKPERQRKILFWLSTSLRLVSRQLYIASMHELRSTYLPAYQAMIRPGYSSDPFPMGVPAASSPNSPNSNANAPYLNGAPPAYETPTPSSSPYNYTPDMSPLLTPHRETPVLDRFILLKVRQDVFADESELHMDREDAFRDLFDVAQPRGRLEDLVRIYGVREGVVSVPGWDGGEGGNTNNAQRRMYTASSNGSQCSSVLSLGLEPAERLSPSPSFSSMTSAPAQAQPPPASVPSPKPTSTWRSFFKKPTSPASSSGASSPRIPSFPSSAAATPPNTKNSTTSSKNPSFHQQQTQQQRTPKFTPLPFPSLSISFSPRRIGLVLNRGRTIAEVLRVPGKKEPLEVLAWGLVRELKAELGAS